MVYFGWENAMSNFQLESSDQDIQNPGRRSFLRAAPVAAAAGLMLADAPLFASSAPAPANGAAKFQVFTAQEIEKDIRQTESDSGNINLVEERGGMSFTMVLTSEKNKIAPEFEMHQHRDHIFQFLEGYAIYEVGGTPQGGRMIGPGEWRGPHVEGATKVTLHKGDRLVVPRNTPHKRSTPESVTFTLISPEGTV
jgi:mannose-6-phosphate isomerase-like protein (cupin superfamily)